MFILLVKKSIIYLYKDFQSVNCLCMVYHEQHKNITNQSSQLQVQDAKKNQMIRIHNDWNEKCIYHIIIGNISPSKAKAQNNTISIILMPIIWNKPEKKHDAQYLFVRQITDQTPSKPKQCFLPHEEPKTCYNIAKSSDYTYKACILSFR